MQIYPKYSEKSLEVELLKTVASHPQKIYLILVEFKKIGEFETQPLIDFISDKIVSKSSANTFKTNYCNKGTRLVLTFYPVDKPIPSKYFLLNRPL